jgi:2,3-bisphosphoglycerate-independent phosphoglycerate mutase
MKYCVIIPDGMADLPVKKLGDRTPLQVARKPNMDKAAEEGLLGQVRTVPHRMPPGSDVAIMCVLGYDPVKYYTGRGPLEAADMGIELGENDWAFRCNTITTDGENVVDFSAGHISSEEAALLVQALNDKLGSKDVRFYAGTGYRHIMIYSSEILLDLVTTPPHDIQGSPIADNLPKGKGSEFIIDLMKRSIEVLENHDVNRVRRDLGKNPANMIWLWGEGKRPAMEPFASRFGCRGAAISAVNLVRGIARLIGWEIIRVPGATAFLDTDYAAKGRYAVDALKNYDIVLVHIEAPDEAAHIGDVQAKVDAIEHVDREIVGPVMAARADMHDLRVLILPDHITSVEKGQHLRGLVPFAMWGAGVKAHSGLAFTEAFAEESEIILEEGQDLMRDFIRA